MGMWSACCVQWDWCCSGNRGVEKELLQSVRVLNVVNQVRKKRRQTEYISRDNFFCQSNVKLSGCAASKYNAGGGSLV